MIGPTSFVSLSALVDTLTQSSTSDVEEILKQRDSLYFLRHKNILYFLIGHKSVCSLLDFIRLLMQKWENAWERHFTDKSMIYILYGVTRVVLCISVFRQFHSLSVRWTLLSFYDRIKGLLGNNNLSSLDEEALAKAYSWIKQNIEDPKPDYSQSLLVNGSISFDFDKKTFSSRIIKRMLWKGEVSFANFIIEAPYFSVAVYLTLVQEKLFLDIEWSDLLKVKKWRHEAKERHSHGISSLIYRSNKLTEWYIWLILLPPLLSGRRSVRSSEVITKLYLIALELYKLNNFDSMISIIMALTHPVVTQLTLAWKNVSKEIKSSLHLPTEPSTINSKTLSLASLCSPSKNWSALRGAIQNRIIDSVDGNPGLAYFGLYISDIICNEEAKEDFDENKRINIDKLLVRSKIVESFNVGCRGMDLMGSKLRKNYFQIHNNANLEVFRACENIPYALNQLLKEISSHPNIIVAQSRTNLPNSKLDMWKVSKMLKNYNK